MDDARSDGALGNAPLPHSARPKLLWPPICWAVVAFTIYAVLRYLKADIEYVARQEMIQVVVYAFLFLAIVNNLHRQESAHVITLTLIFLAMAISAYAVYQFASGSQQSVGVGHALHASRHGHVYFTQ